MASLPPLELHVEIETADSLAQYRWDASARVAEDRPQSIACGSTLMNGYATGAVSLSRNISRSYPDLGLYDTIRFVGSDGQVAYEGRGSRYPREATTVHRIAAEAVGWMAHARDKPITFLGLDGRLSSWHNATGARDAALVAGGFATKGPGEAVFDRLRQSFDGPWIAGELPICEAWFDAGPQNYIGALYYSASPGINVSEADPWSFAPFIATDTLGTGGITPGNLSGAAANTGTFTSTISDGRYALVQFWFNGAGGVAEMQYTLSWTRLVAYGTHGLALVGDSAPFGLLGSDLIKHTASLAAPLLDVTGVQATTHPIELFAFSDPIAVYDMWLVANQYERWNLAVWENRQLTYEPMPDVAALSTADWTLRSDHRNNLRRSYDGPTTDGSKNGVIVRFQNILTGDADMIDPTTTPSLADTNTQLASNRAGIDDWAVVQLPNPNSPTGAARIGAAALAELNRQRTPGRFTITGHIADAAGNWHQGWRVRAGDTILLEEDEADPIRVVHEASWSHDSRELTINADASSVTIDAIVADMGV